MRYTVYHISRVRPTHGRICNCRVTVYPMSWTQVRMHSSQNACSHPDISLALSITSEHMEHMNSGSTSPTTSPTSMPILFKQFSSFYIKGFNIRILLVKSCLRRLIYFCIDRESVRQSRRFAQFSLRPMCKYLHCEILLYCEGLIFFLLAKLCSGI